MAGERFWKPTVALPRIVLNDPEAFPAPEAIDANTPPIAPDSL